MPNVSVRLGIQGQADVKQALQDTGKAGQDAFAGVKAGMDNAGKSADALAAKIKATGDEAKRQGGGGSSPFMPANAPVGMSAAEQRSLEARAAQVRAMIDPIGAASSVAGAAIASYDTLLAKGTISQAEHAKAVALTAAKLEEFKKSAHEASGSNGLNSNQIAESVHVLRALGDEAFSSGLSLRGLLAEGGRIGQIFTEGQGGVAGTFRAFGGILSSILSPVTLVTAAVLGLAAAGAVAAGSYQTGQDGLTRALDGVGRKSGATVAQLNLAAQAGANSGGIGLGEATGLAAGFAGQGINAATTQALIASSRQYGNVTGQGTSEAGAELAKLFADPAKGLDELDKRLGFVNDSLAQQVKSLEASGDIEGARTLATAAFTDALKQTTDTTWTFSKALSSASAGVGDFLQRFGKSIVLGFGGGSDADRLKALQDAQSGLRASDPVGNADEIKALGEQIAQIATRVDASQAKAEADKAAIDARELSRSAGDAVRAILPQLVQAQKAADTTSLLTRLLNDPAALAGTNLTRPQVQQALGQTVLRQDANSDPLRNMATDYALARKEIEAFTLAEHIEVDSRRAEIAVMRESGDARKAALAAEVARNLAIDKANNDASDHLDKVRQDAALVGLSPAEKAVQQIKNQYEGVGGFLSKNDVSGNDITKAMQPVQDDLLRAGDLLADAIKEAAQKAHEAATGAFTQAIPGSNSILASGSFAPNVQAMIADAASKTAIPAAIIAAIGAKENGGRLTGGTTLLGSDGRPSTSYGFGQINNGAAADIRKVHPGFDNHDPSQAVLGTAEYLKILLDRNGGDYSKALDKYGGKAGYGASILSAANVPLSIRGGGAAAALPASRLTAPGDYRKAEGVEVGAAVTELQAGPLKAANDALRDQIALLATQKGTVGQSAEAIQAAAQAQKLFNSYTQLDPGHKVFDWQAITAGVEDYRKSLQTALKSEADFARQQEQTVAALDGIRGAAHDALSTVVSDFEHGASAGKIFQDVASGLLQKFVNLAENQAIDAIFGKSGTTGTGLSSGLGGFVASLFGGGGAAAAGGGGIGHAATGTGDWRGGPVEVGESGKEIINLPTHTSIIPNNVAFAQGGNGGGMPNIVVNNRAPNAKANATVNQGPDGRRQIEVMVDDAMVSNLQKNSRGSQAFAKRAGLSRTG